MKRLFVAFSILLCLMLSISACSGSVEDETTTSGTTYNRELAEELKNRIKRDYADDVNVIVRKYADSDQWQIDCSVIQGNTAYQIIEIINDCSGLVKSSGLEYIWTISVSETLVGKTVMTMFTTTDCEVGKLLVTGPKKVLNREVTIDGLKEYMSSDESIFSNFA